MTDKFSKYDIETEQIGSEEIPLELKFPVTAFTENLSDLKPYQTEEEENYLHLKQYGIPTNLDWTGALSELIMPYAEPHNGLHIETVNSITCKNDTLTIDCIAYDPHY